MSSGFKRAAFAGAVLLMMPFDSAGTAASAAPQARTNIIALTQALMDAIGEGRKEVWELNTADDAIIVDEFGRRQTKAEMIAGLRPFPAGFSGSIEVRDAKVTQFGDTAVLLSEWYERETVFGQKFVVRYIGTCTFVRRGGSWKLVAMEDVTLPTAPPKLAVGALSLGDYAGVYRYGPGRAWTFRVDGGSLSYATKAGGHLIVADPIARDVFMEGEGSDERNLLIFRRNAKGKVTELIERRKFNDLHLDRMD